MKEVNRVLFVCGIHGVGKTVFAKKMSRKLGLKYYLASELIQKRAKYQVEKYKCAPQILDNQAFLLEALSEITDKNYILDGHLCLINDQNEVERISCEIFLEMDIECIYLVVDTPRHIQQHLKNRDGVDWNLELLDSFQLEEIEYAKYLAEEKSIPLKIIDQNRDNQQHSFMEKKNIILPIKPLFAEKVLSGEKKYEYRKKLCQKEINKIYLYSTSPVKMIVGEAEVVDKMRMDKDLLWAKTRGQAGITKEFYDQYFARQDYACAYKIGDVKSYSRPIALHRIGIEHVPQSFIYVDEIEIEKD